jgi:hypothetical protein
MWAYIISEFPNKCNHARVKQWRGIAAGVVYYTEKVKTSSVLGVLVHLALGLRAWPYRAKGANDKWSASKRSTEGSKPTFISHSLILGGLEPPLGFLRLHFTSNFFDLVGDSLGDLFLGRLGRIRLQGFLFGAAFEMGDGTVEQGD